jgi:hypothetical protein
MNTLENLNNWANDDIPYGGDATYSITFDPTSPVNQTTSVIEDFPFVSPVGTNITSMVNTPRDIEYTIDLSGVALAATIDWGTLPYFISSQVAGTNIFKLVGPIDDTVWAVVKSPTITIIDQATSFTYPATITYPDPSNTANDLTKTWNVTVSITASPNISSPTAFQYVKNSPGSIAGYPQITNTAVGTYGIVITPTVPDAVYTLASAGSGGTSVFDPVYKTLTLSGTKTQVNSHLSTIFLTTVSNETRAFVFSYSLTNPSSLINVVTQNFTSIDAYTINTATYIEDTPFSLNYVINDASTTATSFTISVAQTTPLPSVSPGVFTVNGSNVGNTWTASNTRANINSANVIFTPPLDYAGTLTFTVNQSKVDSGNTIIQATNEPVNIVNAGTNPEITNMINRSYTGSTVNNVFATQTPQINDGPDIGQTYTITLYSSLGQFGSNVANALSNSTFSFSGSQSACNSLFASIVFVPAIGQSSTGTFTYTQTRNSTLQVNSTLTFTGIPGTSITPSTTVYTGSSSFSLSDNQVLFGNIQILTVGGGGASPGIQSSLYPYFSSGGGAGGEAKILTSLRSLSSGTYNIVVGTGGTRPSGTTATAGNPTYVSIGGSNIAVSAGGGAGSSSGLDLNTGVGGRGGNVAGRIGGAGVNDGNASKPGGGGASSLANGGAPSPTGGGYFGGTGAAGLVVGAGWGSYTSYGGGGGGGSGKPNDGTPKPGPGGTGGGGRGNSQPGTNGRGGGGGGSYSVASTSGLGVGGSGVVIVKIT